MQVTVGITTYRRLGYLQEAVDSALNQNHDDFEILISQNPHPDPSLAGPISEWCRQLAFENPRVRYQMNPTNVGVAGNVNAIANNALGEFLILLGDDDRLLPDGLSLLSSHVDSDVDVIFANHTVIDAAGQDSDDLTRQLAIQFGRAGLTPGRLSNLGAETASWNVSIAPAASLIRTEVFRKYRYRPNLTKGDTELFIRIARDGNQFVFCDDYVSEIRHHDDRASESVVGFGDLALSLIDAEVSPELELKKRATMELLTRQGVSDSLLHGRLADARRLISSRYYRRFSTKTFLQIACAALPGRIGMALFRRVYRVYRKSTGGKYEDRLGSETLPAESGPGIAERAS